MTKETFNMLLEKYGIYWNDIVEIVIINPKPNPIWRFWVRYPKTIKIKGALNYFVTDNYVKLTANDLTTYTFDFSEIIGIKFISK